MTISVLTPSFNSAKYLERSIESVLKQDHDDWEHIIIDGGSTDGTLEIINKYSHLKYISEPDEGIYDAMNKGIRMAQGEWLYFFGADDQMLLGVLKKIAKEVKGSNLDVIYGDVWSPRFNGRYGGEFDNKRLLESNICHQSIFFRKRIFKIVGYFNVMYRVHADWDHNFKWMLNKKISYKYIDCVIAEYGDVGFSSMNQDLKFRKDKVFNYLKYGWATAPNDFIQILCKREIGTKNLLIYRKFYALMIFIIIYIKSLFILCER